MVTFKTKVYKVEEEDVIGAEVTIYSEAGDKIETIYITSAEQLNDLENRLTDLENRPVNTQEVLDIINGVALNAATLNGKIDSDFATSDHTHQNYATKNHKSPTTDYGVATTSEYGHVKVVDNLTTNNFSSAAPVVLSAKQGYQLNQSLSQKVSKSDIVNNLNSFASNQPLSANQGRILNTNLESVRTTANKVNNLISANWSNAERLELGSEWSGTDCYMMVRNGYVTVTFSALTHPPSGYVYQNPLTPFVINNYKPLMNVKNGCKVGIPGIGEVAATIEVDTAGTCRIFSGQSQYPTNTGVYGMITYPYAGY